VPVPEASVYEYNGFPLRQDDVRVSRQLPGMQTETISTAMQNGTDKQLRSRIFGPDP